MDSKVSVVDTDEGGFAVDVDDCRSGGFETGVSEVEVSADIIAGKVEIVDPVVSDAKVVKDEVDFVDIVETVVGEVVVDETVVGKDEVGDVEICVIEVCETDG